MISLMALAIRCAVMPMLLFDGVKKIEVMFDCSKLANGHEYFLLDHFGKTDNEEQQVVVTKRTSIVYTPYIIGVTK